MAGYHTVHRTRIYNLLKEHGNRTFSVAEISQYLEDNNEPVNNSTIYRYLGKLVKEEQVNRYTSDNGTVYQFAPAEKNCRNHIHLKCIQCGAVHHLDCGFMEDMQSHIENDHHFTLMCENSILYGLCENCKKREN